MSKKSTVPDAWDDDWEALADKSTAPSLEEQSQKKVSSRVNKAQRRAQQAEFNRQLWQEAEGPKETNYFLETRQAVPVPPKSEFKPPPILLSRKGPPTQPGKAGSLSGGLQNLSLRGDSSSDDEGSNTPVLTLEQRQAKAAKEREQKQRKYEERRQELFGTTGSGTSTPSDLTPPGSRSGTPNRGRGGRGRGGNASGSRNHSANNRREGGPKKELYDPNYSPKTESNLVQRKERNTMRTDSPSPGIQPIRAPKGPDGSGRGGFGFGSRGARVS